MARVVFDIDAKQEKAVRAFLDVGRAADKAERKVAGLGRGGKRAGQQTSRAMNQIKSSAMGVLSVLGVGGGIAGGVAAIVREVGKWREAMKQVAESAREAGHEMTAFALMQQPGEIGERVRAVPKIFARFGVKRGMAWNMVQAFQAQTGDYRQGMRAAMMAAEFAQKAEVTPEAAQLATSVGMGLGLTAEDAARIAYAAGLASSVTPEQLAEMSGKGLPTFMGVKGKAITAYAIASAMSKVIKEPGMLGTYTAQVGAMLQRTEGKAGETWRGLGFAEPGTQPVEQLQALVGAGLTTVGKLESAGFALKMAKGLSVLLAEPEQTLGTMREVQRLYADKDIFRRARELAEQEAPEMKYARELDVLDRLIEHEEVFGPAGPRARGRMLRQARAAYWYTALGHKEIPGEDMRVGAGEYLRAEARWLPPPPFPYWGGTKELSPYVIESRKQIAAKYIEGREGISADEAIKRIGEMIKNTGEQILQVVPTVDTSHRPAVNVNSQVE